MGEMIKKYFTGETKEINEEEKTDIGLVSTITIDRDGDVLLPEGCDLTNYKKNPVVQWAHEYWELPIGKALWVKTTDEGVLSKTKYANTEFANDVWELKKGGFLNAYSVGFMPLETITDEREIETIKTEKGINGDVRQIISKWELLEYSICPIPCNPDALTLMSKSVKSKEMKKMLKEIVKHEGDGVVPEVGIKTVEVPITKAGAVLNKKNKAYLKQAQELIQRVLDSAEAEEGEDKGEKSFDCECIDCGYTEESEEHCKDLKCPKCGGQMRRAERPGPGQDSLSPEERKAKEEKEADEKAEAEKKAKEEADRKAEEEKKAAELKAKEEADKKTAAIMADIEKRLKSISERMNYVTGKVD